MARQRLADQRQRADVERCRGRRHRPPARSSAASRRRRACGPARGIRRRHRRHAPSPSSASHQLSSSAAKSPVVVVEKRPVEEGAVGHQSPLNSGVCFAAKASKARRKSLVAMQIAWACASISIAVSRLTAHSLLSWVLVMPWAKVGPSARPRASAWRLGERIVGRAGCGSPSVAFLGGHHPAGEQQLGGAALADDPRQDRAGAHVAAGEADAGEQEGGLRLRRRRCAGPTPWRRSRRRRRRRRRTRRRSAAGSRASP